MPSLLSESAICDQLKKTPGWRRREGRISRSFQFADFSLAFGWMTSCAIVAEKLDHHPEWSNVYNQVEVELTTHDVGGLSDLDFELARRMNQLAGE